MTEWINRRRFMARIAALLVLPLLNLRSARAQMSAADAFLEKITGGAPLQTGRVRLEIPALADNGNSVSLRVVVESPMTPANYVKSIHLVAPKNPRTC